MQLRTLRVGLVGFGKVGRAFGELLLRERDRLQSEMGIDLVVTGLCTANYGSVSEPAGIDLRRVLQVAKVREVQGPFQSSTEFASRGPADVVVETTPLEPFTGAVGTAIIRAALAAGRSVASANKGPVAHHLRELRQLAHQHGVHYRFESAVADGLPVFSLIERTLPGAGVTAVTGLLNSTSAMVLEALSEGRTVPEAIQRAEELGIVEDDPRYDLDGWDAAVKLCALSAALWDQPMLVQDVEREPLSEIVCARAIGARTRGNRLVSLARLQLNPERIVRAVVNLVEIGPDSVFFPLTGTSLGLQFETQLLRPVTISCSEPRLADTAYGLFADVLTIARDDSAHRR